MLILAQRGGFDQARPVLIWIAALIGVTIIGGIAVIKLREYMHGGNEQSPGHAATMLEQIDALKRDGRIGPGEHETLRRQLSQHVKSRMANSGQGTIPPGNRPLTRSFPDVGEARRAPPGYDLTGERLPRPPDSE